MKRFLFLEKYSQCCQREEGLLNTNKRSLKLAVKEKKSEGLLKKGRKTWRSCGSGNEWNALRCLLRSPRQRKNNPQSPIGLCEMESEESDGNDGRARDNSTIPMGST
jgi:hypothetical protein